MRTLYRNIHGQELYVEGERFVSPGAAASIVELGDFFVIPGLWDGHLHFLMWCQQREMVDLKGVVSVEEFLARVARARPDPWITGQGFTEACPSLAELDAVTGNRPALFWRADLHSAQANSAALRVAGISSSSPDPEGGSLVRAADGSLTGRLLELAIALVTRHIPDPTPAETERQFAAGSRELLRMGVTAFTDQRIKGQHEGALSREAFRRLQLPQRIFCNVAAHELGRELPEPSGYFTGHVKFFSDGSLGSKTCKMLDPKPFEGIWMSEQDELRAGFRETRSLGLPICVHAIGDQAIRVCLDLLEELGPSPLSVPDRIEHVQLLDLADLPRLSRLGVTCSMQPLHLLDDKAASERLLGPRSSAYYRLRSLWQSGVRFAFGSDAPVADPSPWLGMHAAVQRAWPGSSAWYPDERIPVSVALDGYTRGAADSVGRSDLGRLEPGCLADFVVLDRVPDASNLLDVRVVRTVVGGETVYSGE